MEHSDGRRAAATRPLLPANWCRRCADRRLRGGAPHHCSAGAERGALTVAVTILFVVFAVLLLLGVPVAFSLAASSLATVLYLGLPSLVVVQQTAAGASVTTLIAIPLFIFAGEMMMRGGISDRLIALASSLVGRLRGGLGQINVLSSLFFGGVSGSAVADVSA